MSREDAANSRCPRGLQRINGSSQSWKLTSEDVDMSRKQATGIAGIVDCLNIRLMLVINSLLYVLRDADILTSSVNSACEAPLLDSSFVPHPQDPVNCSVIFLQDFFRAMKLHNSLLVTHVAHSLTQGLACDTSHYIMQELSNKHNNKEPLP